MATVAAAEHRSRLMRGAVELLRTHRVAALATLEVDGSPFLSMATTWKKSCIRPAKQ